MDQEIIKNSEKELTNSEVESNVSSEVAQNKRKKRKSPTSGKSKTLSTTERLKKVKSETKRKPFRDRSRFHIEKEQGFHYRIVSDNEYPDRIRQGYEPDPNYKGQSFATNRSQDASQIGSARVHLGGPTYGTVMRIKQEYYEQDQKAERDRSKLQQKQLLEAAHNTEGMDRPNISVKQVPYDAML